MKKKIVLLIIMLLLSVGLLSGCVQYDDTDRRNPSNDCNILLVKPNSSFTINGVLHSIHGMNNYLFGQEAKMIYIGNETYFPYVIEVESFESYIGLNVTLNCDYIYYDDDCGKTGYHVRIKFPVIIDGEKE